MSFKTQVILRRIAKIILLITGLGLLGYAGYLTYLSIAFKPYNVRVTNITDSSFTVSWVTDSPMKGVVYYKDTDSVLPGPLGWISSEDAVDDRDFARAQSKCVDDFNTEAAKDMSDDFVVSGDNFDCENIDVKDYGKYYTHHVTLKNLDSEKEYYFKVGDGYLSWGVESDSAKTFYVLDDVKEPIPIFGKVVDQESNYTEDSLVYVKFKNDREGKESISYSSVTNRDGGWYLDGSYTRTVAGELVGMVSGQDLFIANGQYMNYKLGNDYQWIFGYFNGAYPDIVVENVKNDVSSFANQFVFNALAGCSYSDMGSCSTSELKSQVGNWGYGNVVKAIAKQETGGVVNQTTLEKAGLGGNAVTVAGNLSAIAGGSNGITAKEVASRGGNAYISSSGKVVAGSDDDGGHGGGGGTEGDPETVVTTPSSSSSEKSLTTNFSAKMDSNGVVSLTYNNVKIADATMYLSESIKEDLKRNVNTSVTISAVEIDLVKLVNENFDEFVEDAEGASLLNQESIKSALNEDNLEELKTTFMERKALADVIIANAYPVDAVLDGQTVEGYKKKGNQVYYTGELTEEWLKDWSESASEEEKKSFCTSLGETSCSSFSLSTKGNIVVTTSGLEDIKLVAVPDDGVPITTNTYDAMDDSSTGNQASTSNLYPLSATTFDETAYKKYSKTGFVTVDSIKENYTSFMKKYSECISGTGCDAETAQLIVDGFKSSNASTPVEIKTNLDGSITLAYDPGYEGWESNKEEQTLALSALEKITSSSEDDSSSLFNKFAKPLYAEETSESNYSYFLPEYGLFSLQLGNYELTKDVSSGKTAYVFYLEANGIDGIQLPADPDDPQSTEDIVLKSNSYEISYEKQATTKEYTLKKGINLISFGFIPVARDLGSFEATDLIYEAKVSGVTIEYVSTFEGGRWASGLNCKDSECTGSNPVIVPGKGYLVYAAEGGDITIPGYSLKSSIPINFSAGWNLIGVHGYSKAFTAKSFIDNINSVDGLTADNVSWWPTAKGKYEGLQVTDNQEYGLDFPISPANGYFVRINEFEPEDDSCNSIIWHHGGDLNGTCGNSKTILN